jgi:hypothetical protein
LRIGVAEQLKDPESIGGPPVVLVAVEDDRGLRRDAMTAHQLSKLGRADIVAHQRVVEIIVPVDVDRAGDMAGLVEQDIFVAFGEAYIRVVQMVGQPGGADQHIRLGIAACFAHISLLDDSPIRLHICWRYPTQRSLPVL